MNSISSPSRIEIDMRGQVCPSSLLIALEQTNAHKKALRAGETILKIKTDNRDATVTIPGTVMNMGYDCLVFKKPGYYEILIGVNLPGTVT
ncbi:sulfurtransferase TusA family protein [Thermodesulfobacteriota bacterium]